MTRDSGIEVEIHEGRPRQTMFSFRLKPTELQALKDFAESQGMTTGEFVRQSALAAAGVGQRSSRSGPEPYLVIPIGTDAAVRLAKEARASKPKRRAAHP